MAVGRFGAMVGALVWRHSDGWYLLLQRSAQKDFAAGQWECVTGRVEQGESFSEAVRREASEELGQAVQVEFIVGTTHFYRGVVGPEQEMVGVHYGCSVGAVQEIRLSPEHAACQWVTAQEAEGLFPVGHWLRELIGRAEVGRIKQRYANRHSLRQRQKYSKKASGTDFRYDFEFLRQTH